ncbi:substrate-binding domain-containing protein [Streptomyces sp. NBC_00827]|uniref:substrate-binding domain-containing protein n=1 Tax=Streptomyces sp. NBC_00827 TaxID=2903677 RepID=UPI00386EA548|nr:substrate-binding domain-containing protein [Streptomyces sp. NBC_00827]
MRPRRCGRTPLRALSVLYGGTPRSSSARAPVSDIDLEAARQHGLRVPEDFAVMSFDDTLVAAMACPPLSAVRQPFEELGHEATRVLVHMAEGRPPASSRIELATELVLRTSTSVRRPVGTEPVGTE